MCPIGDLSRLDGVSVLVVESDTDNRDLICTALTTRGARVSAAENVQLATEIALRERPDLFIVEIVLSGEDGLSWMRRLRSEALFARVPAIAVTTQGDPRDRERTVRAGYQAHLTKPFDLDGLVAVIVGVLANQELIFRQVGSNLLPSMGLDDHVLERIRGAARSRDYVVSDDALAGMQARGHSAADLLHALSSAVTCVDGTPADSYVVTGPSLAGHPIAIVVKLVAGRVIVV
jgi:DNA-binding response OmpR family regulator